MTRKSGDEPVAKERPPVGVRRSEPVQGLDDTKGRVL